MPVLRHIVEYVRFHARRRPLHPAVHGAGRIVTYAALDRDLRAMRAALRGFGLAPGGRVAVSHADHYVQLLILFALESLGIVSGSFGPGEKRESHALLRHVDVVLADRPVPDAPCAQVHVITDGWIEAALRHDPEDAPGPRPDGDDPVHLQRSSGTTGEAKVMLLPRRIMEWRLRRYVRGLGLTRETRYFAAMPFSFALTQRSAASCFRLGATFLYEERCHLVNAMVSYRPTLAFLLPAQLDKMLAGIEQIHKSGTPLLPDLKIVTGGAKLVSDMRRRAEALLCPTIVEAYGGNDSSFVCIIGPDGVGVVEPGVAVEIVDDAGAPLPVGSVGEMRVRSPGLTPGYLDETPASAALFRDGWFHPGDLGEMVGPGRMRLIGRRLDVLNIGGLKVICADLEAEIVRRTGLTHVAALQLPGVATDAVLAICAVFDPAATNVNATVELIRPIVRECIRSEQFQFYRVDFLPRTDTGKIKRAELQAAITQIPRGVEETRAA